MYFVSCDVCAYVAQYTLHKILIRQVNESAKYVVSTIKYAVEPLPETVF